MLEGDVAHTGRAKQKLQPKQAYSILYWIPKLKAEIEAEWQQKLIDEPGLKTKQGAFLAFMNKRLDQKLKEEKPEVKAEVEAFRNRKDTRTPKGVPLLQPHEDVLPTEEKERLIEVRKRQR